MLSRGADSGMAKQEREGGELEAVELKEAAKQRRI